MSGYSPSRHWQERGQGFGEGRPLTQHSDTNCFPLEMGYSEEPMMNGNVGPPHGILGPNRDFQRQPCSPGSGTGKWNSSYFGSSMRQEPPHRIQYNSWVEHGNNSPRFSDHSNGSPMFSDSEHGRLENRNSPKIMSPFGGRRKRGDLSSHGAYHRFYEQQDRELELDRAPPQFGQSHITDNFYHFDYHHGEVPVHEPEFQEYHQGEFVEHEEFHGRDHLNRSFRGRGGLLSPRGLHPSRGEDRMGMSSFQGSRSRPYEHYSSPKMSASSWSPTCDSPGSPVPSNNSIGPYIKGRGSPRSSPCSSYSPRLEELPQSQQRRPLPPSSQQMFGRNSRIHEKGLVNEVGPNLHGRHGRFDPRSREFSSRTENFNNKVLADNAVSQVPELCDIQETRDPRLRKSNQKQPEYRKQLHEGVDVVSVVCHDHMYGKVKATGSNEEENVNENVVSDRTVTITSPLSSSFLSITGTRHTVQNLVTSTQVASNHERHAEIVMETPSTSSELPPAVQSQSVATTSISQSSLAQPPLTDVVLASSEVKSVILKSDASSKISKKHLTPSLVIKKSNVSAESESSLLSGFSNQVPDSSSNTKKVIRTSKSKDEVIVDDQDDVLPLVFSLNDFSLDLDTEPSSEEEGELSCSSASSILRLEEEARQASEWEITQNDLGRLIRLAKVDAARLNSGVNGRSTPVKLATYASKSSPSIARNPNLMNSLPKRRRRRRKKVGQQNEEELERERTQKISVHVAKENYEDIDAGDEEGGNDDRDDDHVCTISEHEIGEGTSSGLLRSTRAQKLKSSPGIYATDVEEAVRLVNEKLSEGRHSKRQKKVPFEEFQPEVLTTRSRAETATLKRRREQEKEIERNEMERLQTAIDIQDDLESSSSVSHSLDLSFEDSSALSISSSMQSSVREVEEGSTKASLLAEFSPETIAKCKRVCTHRYSGDTPLHKVCRTGKLQMARYLVLVAGASVNIQDHAGWTPLHEACCSNHTHVAELLLKCGADVNVCARDGTRPIHDAIEIGNLEMVKLLVQYGADPMADLGEKTPLEHAIVHNQEEIRDFLESKVQEKMRSRSRKSSSASPASVRKKPTRASRKGMLMKQAEDIQVTIPVDGYGSDGVVCGEELDFPLFYVTPIIELSDCPFLPVYNFQLSNGENPRRHNFHLISDILNCLDVTEEDLLNYCNNVHPVEFTVAEVLQQIDSSTNCHKFPESIMSLPHSKKLKFLPLCQQLRELLDITVENLDD